MTLPAFRRESAAILADLQALRRELHTFPELGNETPRTQQFVIDALDGLPIEITRGESVTSVVGVLRGRDDDGPVVLIRGDMDGLPVQEDTGLAYASVNGNMHACGHDLHTSGLIGAARLLSAHRDELPGTVIFMFQPGEESHAGARYMLEDGLLDVAGKRPIGAYGLHVMASGAPYGTFVTRPGTFMGSSNILRITVTGRGGHGSAPYQSLDPVTVITEIVQAIQTYVTRRVSVFDPVVISVTQLSAGQAVNVIPSTASLGATVRTLSTASLTQLDADLPALADGIAAAHGCTAQTQLEHLYPVTVNDPARTAWTVAQLGDVFGAERVVISPDPFMGSEDFSYVLNEIPGTYLFVGAGPADADAALVAPGNHSAHAQFDDRILADQAAALSTLAWQALAEAS